MGPDFGQEGLEGKVTAVKGKSPESKRRASMPAKFLQDHYTDPDAMTTDFSLLFNKRSQTQEDSLMSKEELQRLNELGSMSVLSGRPGSPVDVPKPLRPHTSMVYIKDYEDIEIAFQEALEKYQRSSGSDKLYKNDGTQFDENWQDRLIERHFLLKLQQQIRVKSAAERRHLLELRQKMKRKALLGHRDCDTQGGGPITKSDTSLHILNLERANTTLTKASSFSGSGRRTSPLASASSIRPRTAFSVMTRAQYQDQQKQEERSELSVERPFRIKMNPEEHTFVSQPRSPVRQSNIDIHNLQSVVLKQKSSKSIPSKCSRYVLISHPKERSPHSSPSVLEEQLLRQRFPKQAQKILSREEMMNRGLSSPVMRTYSYSPTGLDST